MHHLRAHKEKTEQFAGWDSNQTEVDTYEKDPFDTTEIEVHHEWVILLVKLNLKRKSSVTNLKIMNATGWEEKLFQARFKG